MSDGEAPQAKDLFSLGNVWGAVWAFESVPTGYHD